MPAESLLAELAGALDEAEGSILALRGTRRWVQTFEPVRLGDGGPPPLRARGTYLITGGSGGVGLEIARFLARTVQARLAPRLPLGRPEPTHGSPSWKRWAREVLALAADVTDRGEMRAALEAARARFGPLHGVLMPPGLPGSGVMQLTPVQSAADVLAPKVQGTLILDELLAEGRDPEIDFLVLCSSLSAVMGGPGQADYAAANAFLDAFARSRARTGGPRVVSIDWDAWRGVGMAAVPAGKPAAAPAPEPGGFGGEAQALAHPLLLQRLTAGAEEVFLSRFQTGRSWVLDEHRLGGHPVVPGTTYLEMAGAAFGAVTGNGNAFEMRDVLFVAPLRVGDGESTAVRTVLRQDGGAYRFSVASDGQEHALGSIQALHGAPATLDLSGLRSAAHTQTVLGEEYREDLRTAGLGPRWESLRKVWLGDGYALGYLELGLELGGDAEDYRLHPALLDIATGVMQSLGTGAYLPLAYEEVVVHGPLPRRLWSRFRLQEGGMGETLAGDLSLLDEEGWERVAIRGFTLRRLDPAALPPPLAAAGPSDRPAEGPRGGLAAIYGEGLRPAAGGRPSCACWVGACARPSSWRLRAICRPCCAAVARSPWNACSASWRSCGRAPVCARVPPCRRPGRRRATRSSSAWWGSWRTSCGSRRWGSTTASSTSAATPLLATRLLGALGEAFDVQLSLRTVFEAPSAAELALAVIKAQAADVDAAELAAALNEIRGLSPAELQALLAEEERLQTEETAP